MSTDNMPPITPPQESDKADLPVLGRYRELARPWRAAMAVLTAAATFLAVNQIFALGFFMDIILLDGRYLYLITGLMLIMVFITFPSHPGNLTFVPWYDKVLMAVIALIFSYFAWNADLIILDAWEYSAPTLATTLALLTWAIVLEAGRRAGGWPIFFIVLVLSLYPTFADRMPDVVAGIGMPLQDVAIFHILGEESMFGVALNSFAMLVFGFILFGVALQHTGGGPFFINLAFALLGHKRGGAAKVAVFSSGLMGSMSGGPITNVLTTGPMTIPAMRRTGFSRGYAAGVEACASTGGVMMPPIMGATAFVMASFLSVSYVTVAVAAIVPSFLYFFGLYMQIDAYSARNNLQGLPKEEMPNLKQVFKDGWYFIGVFAVLTFMLVYMQREATAPFIATVVLLIVNQFTKHRMDLDKFMVLVAAAGRLMAELAGILAAIGLIVGSLAVTGMAGTLANDLVFLAGDNVLVLLFMGAATSFVLGIGMTVTAAYIFLAIVLAPALINAGLNPLASHMFIMYWGMLSFITPPVALAAFAAASVAQVSPMRAGLEAMRLGAIIYFIPFFFVLHPALLLQGDITEILLMLSTALFGVILISAGLQGYLIGYGSLGSGNLSLVGRACMALAGLALAAPSGGLTGTSQTTLFAICAVLLAISIGITTVVRRQQTAAA
ncbi:MAG TPA: TRAP transporter fused permease subunit [Pseudohongiella sp.]|nr:TRAP transporter fused permease subunit [Pseudohongiella sp.]